MRLSRRISTRKKILTPDPGDCGLQKRRIPTSVKAPLPPPPSTNFLSFLFSGTATQSHPEDIGRINKCLICLSPITKCVPKPGPKSKKPKLVPPTTLEQDKFVAMLHFISEDCLGQKVTEDEVKAGMHEGRDDCYLCENHIKLVQKALEIEKLIRNMIQELDGIKEAVRQEVENQRISNSYNNVEIKKQSTSDLDEDELEVELDPTLFLDMETANSQETEIVVGNILSKSRGRKKKKKMRSRKGFTKKRSSRLQRLPSCHPDPDHVRPANEPMFEETLTNEFDMRFKDELYIKSEPVDDLHEDYDMEDLDYPVPSPVVSEFKNFSQSSDSDSNFRPIKKRKLRPRNKTAIHKLPDREANENAKKSAKKSKSIRKIRARAKSSKVKSPKDVGKREKKPRPRPAIKRFICHLCYKPFITKEERKNHKLDVHGPGPYFPCDECSNQYMHKYELKTHRIITHGAPSKKSFTCEECQKSFPAYRALSKHKELEHTPIEILDCLICTATTGKKYKGKKNLSAHMRNFHKDRPGLPSKHLVCEFCGQAFSNTTDFQKHRDKVHLKTYQKTPCDICGRMLSDVKSLRKHKLSQHNKSYQFKCQLCGSGSLFKSHLIAHLKSTHTSLSPEELEDLILNCKKIVDNTNPIYRQKQDETEPNTSNDNPNEPHVNMDTPPELGDSTTSSNERSVNNLLGPIVPVPPVQNQNDVFSELMDSVEL